MSAKMVALVTASICIVLAVSPVQALTAKDLTITLDQNGNANVVMEYQLSVPEYFAVFLRVADPKQELTRALDSSLQKEVTVESFDSTSAKVLIPSFASVTNETGIRKMTTPQVSFAHAQEVVSQYWFAALISPDFSPENTEIIFPDGYTAGFSDEMTIPSVSHILNS
ncbi:MAG: hypothetical protein ABFC24_08850 [Methanoregulaceae archaeon]